ncbi:S8 family serine peptidase [Hazenella sp. IB182353]|nr:S8 family serine peptidase [Polycladospora coralii]
MLKKNRSVFTLSWILSILVIVMSFAPGLAMATENTTNLSLNDNKQVTPAKKISKRLTDQFNKQKEITFLVKFSEQTNTQKVAKDMETKAKKQKVSAFKKELMKRSAVISELRLTAEQTQAPVMTWLEKQKQAGRVSDYKSFFIVNAIAVTGDEKVMKELAQFNQIAKILPNETRQLVGLADKSKASGDITPQSTEWNLNQIGVPGVWEKGIDGSGVVIANIDTGVQWDHPALKEKYRGYDPATGEADHTFNWFDPTTGQAIPYDDQGHGTHTMGTMVGAEPDGSNQIGVAPGAKWIAVKAFTALGGTDADLLAAGEWILAPTDADGTPHPEKAPDVVNNSWGGGPGLDEWYRPMVENWRAADIFPEFSAGNDGGTAETIANPANYPESFATGATDSENNLASFSSKGPSPYNEVKPEISAPGVNIRSAIPGSGYEGGWNGTSMAGPHVAGVVALLKQANASLSIDQIEQILTQTAIPLTDSTFPDTPNNGYGHGLVNAYDAVSSVIDGLGEVKGQVLIEGEDTEEPTWTHDAPSIAFENMDLPLNLSVSDNISIQSVQLHYRGKESDEWKQITANRTSGDYRSGVYQAIIPGADVERPTLSYYWTVNDFGNNEVTSDTYAVEIQPGITRGYEQDFETYPAGWSSYGAENSWEWGIPTAGPVSAMSGEKVYATNLSGDYANNANMNLLMPPIDLPEGTTYLQFKSWYELETSFDYGKIFVSRDQQSWTELATYNGTSGGWIEEQVDLSVYAGERIYVTFNVTSDLSITNKGWYIDDLRLTDEAISPTKKAQLGVEKTKSEQKRATAKKAVDPKKIKPAKKAQVVGPQTHTANSGTPKPTALPLVAQVSVLESGRSTTSSPADGSYALYHAAGDYTLRAEAYGYQSQDRAVNIPRDSVVEANFVLEAIAQGTVSGKITNEKTGEPIADATVALLEDARIEPVKTDEDGNYALTAYQGNYTLKVTAPTYYAQEMTVEIKGNETITKDLALKPFIGYPGEIGYDDGTADNARAWNAGGNSWAVKMSLAEGHHKAMVTAGVFRFWDTEWPVPGGDEFAVEVYDASGTDGAPGKKLAGPIDATALRNGDWTVVDLSAQGIVVEGDFYMVYQQKYDNPNTPGLATDEDGVNAERSWQRLGGAWSPTPLEEGNYMIRARVNYEVTPPIIESPKNNSLTNKEKVTVTGKAAPTTTVKLFNGGEEIATTPATDEGTFSVEINLKKGENVLTATSVTESGGTEPSAPITITLDQKKPVLTIDSPLDGLKTNKEVITVSGKAVDENLDKVKVNGKKATLKEDGTFTYRLLLSEGENKIKVLAIDQAGNKVKKTVKVYVKSTPPTIENLHPNEDITLKSGESVKIELDSETDLKASYIIRMPLANPVRSMKTSSITEFPMMEDGEGHYTAYYTATSNLKNIQGAVVEVILRDEFGNEIRKEAAGKLFINVKK